jgi:nucleotide-binding universal stress UspA family protein
MVVLFAAKLTEPRSMTDAVSDLAERLDADLWVLHVAPPVPASAFTSVDPMTGLGDLASYALYDPQLQEDLEKAEASAFDEFLQKRFKRSVRASLKTGYPAAMILEDARDHAVDLIIVGKRHHSRIERFLMGDVAREVSEQSDYPVLLMPVEEDRSSES